jgi:tRNA threonylcarbamoyladenosine biosynthesis protein TsaE
MFSKKVQSTAELESVAAEMIEAFGTNRVFAFYGKMGAGKTTFIQSLCRALGSNDNVTSPTFALINEYDAKENSIFHFDFYRIKDIEEAFDLGYEDYIYSGSYCFIEWPEMIEQLLPEHLVEVNIEVLDDDTREIAAKVV